MENFQVFISWLNDLAIVSECFLYDLYSQIPQEHLLGQLARDLLDHFRSVDAKLHFFG